MTLEEAIRYYEKMTEEQNKCIPCDGCPFDKRKEKHRQIAEWLRKLKAYESDAEICKYCTHTHDSDYCNMCKHNTILVDYFDLEVNTDD